jgi:hypothetical protein
LRYGALRCLPSTNGFVLYAQIEWLTPKASYLPSGLIADKFLDVSGPFIQGLALFVRVLMPLVKDDNSTFASGDMIQHL